MMGPYQALPRVTSILLDGLKNCGSNASLTHWFASSSDNIEIKSRGGRSRVLWSQVHIRSAKESISRSLDRRNSRKLTALYLQVSKTLRSFK